MEHIDEKQPPDVLTSDGENATTIPVDEAPPHKREQFRRFRAYNTGLWNGPRRENKQAMYRQDNLHRYDAIASQLDLTPFQQKRGRVLLDDLDFMRLGRPVDYWLWAVCVVVANDDVADGTRYWPTPDGGSGVFAQTADDLEMDYATRMSAIMTVKNRLEV